MAKFVKVNGDGDNWINVDQIREITGSRVIFANGEWKRCDASEIDAILRASGAVGSDGEKELLKEAVHEATIDDFELGNLLFGHSRGDFSIPRTKDYEDVFHLFLERSGFDAYGHPENKELESVNQAEYGFENDVFIIRPYYWGDDDDIAALPNFEYKPTGFSMTWYKYPLRDAYANANIEPAKFYNMLCECEKSLDGAYGGPERATKRPDTTDEYMDDMAQIELDLADDK